MAKLEAVAAEIADAGGTTLAFACDIREEAQVRATVEAATASPGRPLGWQSEDLWKSTLDLLVESGSIKEKRPLGEYYTNTLLE